METTLYTFTANEIVAAGGAFRQACGGDRRMVYLRHPVSEAAPAGGKVIDFNAWRAAREDAEAARTLFTEQVSGEEDALREGELFAEECFEPGFPLLDACPAPRRQRTDHSARGMYLDWIASAAVAVTALCASISFFL